MRCKQLGCAKGVRTVIGGVGTYKEGSRRMSYALYREPFFRKVFTLGLVGLCCSTQNVRGNVSYSFK